MVGPSVGIDVEGEEVGTSTTPKVGGSVVGALEIDGVAVGTRVGVLVVGCSVVGLAVGVLVGVEVSSDIEGAKVKKVVGPFVGSSVGILDDSVLGEAVGTTVSTTCSVGTAEGAVLGELVGTAVTIWGVGLAVTATISVDSLAVCRLGSPEEVSGPYAAIAYDGKELTSLISRLAMPRARKVILQDPSSIPTEKVEESMYPLLASTKPEKLREFSGNTYSTGSPPSQRPRTTFPLYIGLNRLLERPTLIHAAELGAATVYSAPAALPISTMETARPDMLIN